MKTINSLLALITTLASLPAMALQTGTGAASPTFLAEDPQPVQPATPAPSDPPPPPGERPLPPTEAPGTVPGQEPPTGQWVYTSQYGWVWMPYGNQYTHAPADGGTPNMYVYYPEVGWSWVLAPWLWGWGPMPYFGLAGYRHFGWYGVGLGCWYGWSGPYYHAGWYGRGYYRGGSWHGVGRGHDGRITSGAYRGPRGTIHPGSPGGSSRVHAGRSIAPQDHGAGGSTRVHSDGGGGRFRSLSGGSTRGGSGGRR